MTSSTRRESLREKSENQGTKKHFNRCGEKSTIKMASFEFSNPDFDFVLVEDLLEESCWGALRLD